MKALVKKWWFWLIVLIVFGMIINIFTPNDLNDNNTAQNSSDLNYSYANQIIQNTINQNTINSEEKKSLVTFLSGTDGQDFYSILCEVSGVAEEKGVAMGDSIDYASSNTEYGIQIETNKKNEINWISIYTMLPNNYENFFLAIARLEYNGSNRSECFNWIKDNLGKEATTKIGDANFKLYNSDSGTPILDVYTDGNEEYQKEQLNKISNN